MVAWTENDLVILAKVMKKKISNKECQELFREYGLSRKLDVMKKRWAKLRSDYTLVRLWEEDPKQTVSYFELKRQERKLQGLPVGFSERVYEVLSNCPMPKKRKVVQKVPEYSPELHEAHTKMNVEDCKSEGQVETMLVPAAHWCDDSPIVFLDPTPPDFHEVMEGISFADACLRLDDEDVMDGVPLEAPEHTEAEPLRALPALEDAHATAELVEMLEKQSHEARLAVESYDRKRMQWQKDMEHNQQGEEFLMKADCDVLSAIRDFVSAAQSLINKLA